MEVIILTVLIILAIGVATYAVITAIQNQKLLKNFLGDSKDTESLMRMLQNYYDEIKSISAQNKQINSFIDQIVEQNKRNISSLITRKFNPYDDSGGDLSFCIVLLDRELNGVMITSLHGRERTRMYSRTIVDGKSSIELLYDEQEALKEAVGKIKS